MRASRIAWVIKGLARGGAERLVTSMTPRIRDRGYDVEVLYVTASADGFVPELAAAGVPVRCVGAGRARDPRWLSNLARTLRTGNYDLVHTHSPLPGAISRLATPRGIPMVHTEHNMWDAYRFPTYVANAATLARNGTVYAVSEGVLVSMRRPWWSRPASGPEPQILLHGVDSGSTSRGPAARRIARTRLGIDGAVPVIGHVANLSVKKDQATLLEAFSQVVGELPSAILVIAGDGPLRSELEHLVEALGLSESVRFLGSRDDVGELLPAFDVFALSSTYEGLPISLLEAMAAEVACVSTAVGGIPEAVRSGLEAELVPAGDADALGAALRAVLNDDAHRAELASAARSRVEAAFSIDNAVERTCSDYERALHGVVPFDGRSSSRKRS